MNKLAIMLSLAFITSITLAQNLLPVVSTNSSRTITKTVSPYEVDAIISGVQSFGISSPRTPITRANMDHSLLLATPTNNFACYIYVRPTTLLVTNISASGAKLITSTVVTARVRMFLLSNSQLESIKTFALGDVSDLGVSDDPTNIASIYLGPQTNTVYWQIAAQLK